MKRKIYLFLFLISKIILIVEINYDIDFKPSKSSSKIFISANSKNIAKVGQFVSVLCEKLADDNMAHNIAFIRGKRLNHEIDSDEFVLRVYIWPRRPTLGSRVLYQ